MAYTDENHSDTKAPAEDPPSYSPPTLERAEEIAPSTSRPVLPENIHPPQPPFCQDPSNVGPDPASVVCPRCHYGVQTQTKGRVGVHAGVWAGICCLACGFIAALLPLLIPQCQDIEHTCPHCGFLMARFQRGNNKVKVFPVEEGYVAVSQDDPNLHVDHKQVDGIVADVPKTS